MTRRSKFSKRTLLSTLVMSNLAFAGAVPDAYYTAHHLRNPNPPKVVIVLPAIDWTRHFFVGVGLKTEWIRLQEFSTASSTVYGGTTVLNARDDYTAWIPELSLGYHFNQAPFLPAVFGQAADIDLLASGFRAITHSHPSGTALGYLYNVAGRELTAYPLAATLHNASYRGNLSQYNLGLNYLGHWMGERFSLSPFVGLAYHNLYENSQYNIQASSTDTTELELNSNFRTRTQYTGLAFGNDFAYQLSNRWQALADLEIEALYAYSRLTANSQYFYLSGPGDVPETTAHVQSSLSKDITGKGTVDAGLRYAFSDQPDAMSLKLTGGVEAWSYVPKVVTSASSQNAVIDTGYGRATYVAAQSLVNPFVSLEFVAPF